MARRFVELVFDDFILGTTDVFTSERFDELLGAPSRLALQVVTDLVTGSSPTLSVQALQTADGRNLNGFNPGSSPEINRETLNSPAATVLTGYVDYPAGALRRVRLKLTLGGTSPSAHVKVYATGRDRA